MELFALTGTELHPDKFASINYHVTRAITLVNRVLFINTSTHPFLYVYLFSLVLKSVITISVVNYSVKFEVINKNELD